ALPVGAKRQDTRQRLHAGRVLARTARYLGARAALQKVLHAHGEPHVMSSLRPFLDLERLELGERQVVALPFAQDDLRRRAGRALAVRVELDGAIVGAAVTRGRRRHGLWTTAERGRARERGASPPRESR